MRYQNVFKYSLQFIIIFFLTYSVTDAQRAPVDIQKEYIKSAKKIRIKYEHNAFKLNPSKAGHMGLRLWRNYRNDKYEYLLLQGINHTASALDKLVANGLDKRSLDAYVDKKNKKYNANTKKKKKRKNTFSKYPNYRLMGTKILRHVARLDELGLRHEKHDEFMRLINSYDFKKAFTDPLMIKAWGAQLANQVYWLHNLGVADYRAEFKQAVTMTYPAAKDNKLSKQQFENKIYTLTHIIIAASGYYQHQVEYEEYRQIIDYLRSNTDLIIEKVKEDIIIEVGLSFLLVNESYQDINIIRNYIHSKVDSKKKMVLSENGNAKVSQGEHRNIIAVLLLDWKGCSSKPTSKDIEGLNGLLVKSLVKK